MTDVPTIQDTRLAANVRDAIDTVSAEFHDLACRNGFWEGVLLSDELESKAYLSGKYRGGDNTPEFAISERAMKHALINTELGEATEALRKGNPPDDHLPDFPQELVEMADIIIRIGDYCAAFYPPGS